MVSLNLPRLTYVDSSLRVTLGLSWLVLHSVSGVTLIRKLDSSLGVGML